MTLSEFIQKRLEEMGKNRSWLVNFNDLEWSTLTRINKGLPITKATQEKLAKALECSQGDIQACMADVPNPLREEAERPEGNAGISITAGAGKSKKKVTPAPDPKDEEPAEVFQEDDEDEQEEMAFPAYHSVYEEDRQEGEERYKQKLRDMCLRIFSSGIPGTHTMKDIYADIGYAIVKELAKGGDKE